MKLTSEQLNLAQRCKSADELISKAKEEGFSLTREQAQKIIDASEFAEIEEGEFDMIAGGACYTPSPESTWKCDLCGQTYPGNHAPWRYCLLVGPDANNVHYACENCYQEHKNDTRYLFNGY